MSTRYLVRNADLDLDLCHVIGSDPLDAVAGMLQATGARRDISEAISVEAETERDGGMTDPAMVETCRRAAPRASDPDPWPAADAIRAVVAVWWARHPEIVAVAEAPVETPSTGDGLWLTRACPVCLAPAGDVCSVQGGALGGEARPVPHIQRRWS